MVTQSRLRRAVRDAAYEAAYEEGYRQGLILGLRKGLAMFLEIKFGKAGLKYIPKLDAIDNAAHLQAIVWALCAIKRLADVAPILG